MHRLLVLALAAPLLWASGCDETGRLDSGTPTQLLASARLARQTGDYATALRLLDVAAQADPSLAAVPVEQAVTLLERDGINLFDLERLATFVTDGTAAPGNPPPPPLFCPFALDPRATPFDPTAYAGFADIQADLPTIREALDRLDPVVPDAIQSYDLCDAVVDGSGGPTLAYDADAALAEMRALGLTDAEIGAALVSDALGRFLLAYHTVTTSLSQQVTWYRTNDGSGVGVCAADPQRLQDEAEASVLDLGEAAYALDLRGVAVGSAPDIERLVDLLVDGYTEIRDGIGRYCTP